MDMPRRPKRWSKVVAKELDINEYVPWNSLLKKSGRILGSARTSDRPHCGIKDAYVEPTELCHGLRELLSSFVCTVSYSMTTDEAQKGISTDWRQYLPQVNAVAIKRKEIE